MPGECAHLPRARTSSPRDTWQKPLPLHMRGKPPTASATLVQTFSAEGKVALEPQTWRAGRQKTATQVTTSLQPRWPTQRGAPDFLSTSWVSYVPRLLARWSTTPSVSAAPVCGEPSPCKAHTSVVSKANWDPPKMGNPSATTSNLRLSAASGRGKSRSRTRTLVATRAPASRHTRAAALSSAKPRRPHAPVLVHDAGWWPNESIGRPHRHMHRESGNGIRRRRSKMVLKRCGAIFVINVVGDTINANPAPEPPWDRRIARSLDPMRSKRTSCLKWRSTLDAASCCHPPRAMPGSISSGSSALGRTPSQRASRWFGGGGGGRRGVTTHCAHQ